MQASEWAFDRIKEAFELVAQDEAEKMSIVQETMLRSTDYLRRIIAPVGGHGGVTMSYLCPNWQQLPSEKLCADSFEHAKVFKAHAVPQSLCANLINAQKLLANQQEDYRIL